MAIFEKESHTKAKLDDTEKLTCTIENAQNINKHTEYILLVQRGSSKETKWSVSRRYRDFAALHAVLQQANIDLPLPPKKLIGNMQPSFIAERLVALQAYLNAVLRCPILALSLPVRSFLDPNNYLLTIAEQALQTVSIALRGDGQFELKGPLADIGWRVRKHYFMVTDTESRTNCLLAWQNYGPDRYLSDKDLQAAFKSLKNVNKLINKIILSPPPYYSNTYAEAKDKHPHIDKILAIHSLETGAYVVRRIHENGSLRDVLHGTEYTRNHLAKYGNPKVRKPLTEGQIAHYGYQLLQALKFLHDKGLPHGHVHPGNIAIENQKVLLMDIENSLLGVSCIHRPYLLEMKRVASAEAVDLYCFGRTLYEMAFAEPLHNYYRDLYPEGISTDLESVLRICISSTSCKHGTQYFDQLLLHPFFSRATLNGVRAERDHLKFPLPLKDELKNAMAAIEARLKAEQKQVRSAKREVRIQEILNSETELKKQKRRARKRDSMWKSTSSLAETVRSHSGSTLSSPTPPHALAGDASGTAGASPCAPSDARGALLSAICRFDKTRLARVNSR